MRLLRALVAASCLGALPAAAQSPDVEGLMKSMGMEAIRSVDSDLCLPADGDEYVALGKNAVLMLTSRSALGTELPLRSVYITAKELRVPLQRIARMDKTTGADGYAEQVSFYLIPIQFTKIDAHLEVDFAGERKGFGVLQFTAGGGTYSKDTPPFVRLDEYDDPSEPDARALAALLTREYPEFFGEK